MKTSELIRLLQEIDKTVPFDADIVTGDDFEPLDLISVYHNPPRTYLQFGEADSDDLDDDLID